MLSTGVAAGVVRLCPHWGKLQYRKKRIYHHSVYSHLLSKHAHTYGDTGMHNINTFKVSLRHSLRSSHTCTNTHTPFSGKGLITMESYISAAIIHLGVCILVFTMLLESAYIFTLSVNSSV